MNKKYLQIFVSLLFLIQSTVSNAQSIRGLVSCVFRNATELNHHPVATQRRLLSVYISSEWEVYRYMLAMRQAGNAVDHAFGMVVDLVSSQPQYLRSMRQSLNAAERSKRNGNVAGMIQGVCEAKYWSTRYRTNSESAAQRALAAILVTGAVGAVVAAPVIVEGGVALGTTATANPGTAAAVTGSVGLHAGGAYILGQITPPPRDRVDPNGLIELQILPNQTVQVRPDASAAARQQQAQQQAQQQPTQTAAPARPARESSHHHARASRPRQQPVVAAPPAPDAIQVPEQPSQPEPAPAPQVAEAPPAPTPEPAPEPPVPQPMNSEPAPEVAQEAPPAPPPVPRIRLRTEVYYGNTMPVTEIRDQNARTAQIAGLNCDEDHLNEVRRIGRARAPSGGIPMIDDQLRQMTQRSAQAILFGCRVRNTPELASNPDLIFVANTYLRIAILFSRTMSAFENNLIDNVRASQTNSDGMDATEIGGFLRSYAAADMETVITNYITQIEAASPENAGMYLNTLNAIDTDLNERVENAQDEQLKTIYTEMNRHLDSVLTSDSIIGAKMLALESQVLRQGALLRRRLGEMNPEYVRDFPR